MFLIVVSMLYNEMISVLLLTANLNVIYSLKSMSEILKGSTTSYISSFVCGHLSRELSFKDTGPIVYICVLDV